MRPRGIKTEDFNPSQWDAISRKAGIVGGLEQWRTRLEVHARRLSGDADRREAAGDISIARARGMRYEAAASRVLLTFIDKLASDLQPPPDGSSWRLFAEWTKGLLREYLAHDTSAVETMALERIQRALDEFNSADSIDSVATIQSFREMVAEALQAPFGHLGPTGQGVYVSPFSAAAGLTFDAVWLVGMIEGAVPPAICPDPLLADHEWMSAGGIDRARQRMAEERYQYLAAVSGTQRRTLSYPITHASSQRQAYPSRWFLEQASALEGATVDTGNLLALGDREWLSIDESVEASLNTAGSASFACEHDYRLAKLLRWRRANRNLLSHPFVERGPLAGTLRALRNRSQPRLTEFDGNLASLAGQDRFGVGLRGAPISPTGLESWATCPYRSHHGDARPQRRPSQATCRSSPPFSAKLRMGRGHAPQRGTRELRQARPWLPVRRGSGQPRLVALNHHLRTRHPPDKSQRINLSVRPSEGCLCTSPQSRNRLLPKHHLVA